MILAFSLGLLACGGKKVEPTPLHQVSAHNDLVQGNTWYMRGCLDKSAIYFDMALERFTAYDDLAGVAICLNNLGNISRIKKDGKTALSYLDESERIFNQINNPEGVVRALSNKAAVYLDQDQLDSAEAALDQARDLLTPPDQHVGFLSVWSNRVLLLIRKNEIEKAKTLMAEALVSASPDRAFEWGTLQHVAGYLMESAKEYDSALSYYKAALSSDRKHYYLRGIAQDLTAMGRVHAAMDRPGDALDYLYRSMKVRTLMGDANDIEETSTLLKECLTTLGDDAPDTRITDDMLSLWSKGDTVAAPCE